MNDVLAQLSPKVSEMGTRVLNSRVEPLVQGALATLNLGRKAFKFTRINLGQVKPKLTNLRTHGASSKLNRITVDFDLMYLGDGDIQVSILGASSGIKNVKVGGRARIMLTPTMSELPLVGGVQFFFLTKPELDFEFDGVAKIADLPVIKKKIKEDLLGDLNKQAVYPHRITIPLSWTADPMQIWQPQMTGILGVKLKSVRGLPRRGGMRRLVGQDKPDVYGIIGLGGKEWRSGVKKNSVEATWEDWYEFPLELLDGHLVELNMYDDDSSSSDEFLGYAAVDVKNYMQQPNFITAQVPKTQSQAQPTASQSTLPSDTPLMSKVVTATLQAVPGRKSKYTNLTGTVELELAWQPLIPFPGPDTSRLFPGSTKALLTVFVYSANNLAQYADGKKFAAGHLPSPQVTLSVANYTMTSGITRDTQQAIFNHGEQFPLRSNWKTQTLTLSVQDTEQSGSFGEVRIPLSSILGKDSVKEILPLSTKFPSQTITFSAMLRFPFGGLNAPASG